jgi:hypothetical protein
MLIRIRYEDWWPTRRRIGPGVCHACRRPVSLRQASVVFPGPNLLRPDLGDDSALFHMRPACMASVRAYDERWAQETGNDPMFSCAGLHTVYPDQSAECTNIDCPGNVDHAATIWERTSPPR